MSKIIQCPMCSNDLPESRMFASIICCPCGWTYSHGEFKHEMKSGITANLSILGFSIALVGIIIHIMIWDNHSINIVQPAIKSMMGNATANDFALMAHICKERDRYGCQVDALSKLIDIDSNEIEAYGALAKAHWNKRQNKKALNNLARYFEQGGQDMELAYLYAKVLRSVDRHIEAETYYKLVLKSKPDVIQTTIAREFVSMLTDIGQFNKARKLINYYRNKSTRPDTFMSQEIKALNEKEQTEMNI